MIAVSCDYQELLTYREVHSFLREHENVWQDPRIPPLQYALVQDELERFRRGEEVEPYTALSRAWPKFDGIPTVLDVGAAFGQYREVLSILGYSCMYVGIEWSDSFIQLGHCVYPDVNLHRGKATHIVSRSDAYDIVLHSGVILHVLDYATAIREAIRVARKYVLFHRTPLSEDYTRFYSKKAYGLPCLEIHFNRTELIGLMMHSGKVKVTEPVAGSFLVEKL